MFNWNAIDLHVHTKSGRTRDKKTDNVNFSYLSFYKAIKKHDIKLMAITNHNIGYMPNYILSRYIGELAKCNVLPGIELDSVTDNGKPLHIAAISKDNFYDNISFFNGINEKTEEKIKSSDNELIFTAQEIVELLNTHNLVLIPHGDKERGCFKDASAEDIYNALRKIREGFIRIFDCPSNWKLECIKRFLNDNGERNIDDFGGVLFSDIRDWDNYDDRYRDFYMHAEPTFNGLIHSMTNPTKRFSVGSEISKNRNYISKIIIDSNDTQIMDSTINFSSGYNCIIGKSGSGKSLLLNLIENKLIEKHAYPNKYKIAENTIIHIFDENENEIDFSNINITIGKNLYECIIKAMATKDSDDVYEVIKLLDQNFTKREKFDSFIKSYKEKLSIYRSLVNKDIKDNEEIISLMVEFDTKNKQLNDLSSTKIFDIKPSTNFNVPYSDEDIQVKEDIDKNIEELYKFIKIYKGKNKQQLLEDMDKIKKEFDYAKNYMNYEMSLNNYKNRIVNIVNGIIGKINENRSNNAKSKSDICTQMPILRKNITQKVTQLYICNVKKENIDLSISIDELNDSHYIANDESIRVEENYDIKKLKKINIRENEIFKTYGVKQKLVEKGYDITNKKDAKELIDTYINIGLLKEDSEIVLNDEFVPEVEVYFNNQNIKELNPGNIAKKYISVYFNKQVMNGKYNVVLFDQIENDVDKPFIYNTLRELIEQTKGKIQSIIVTHDPIIAVNSDPDNYIECIKDDRNLINYRNFIAESEEVDELDTISRIVDGSKEAIRNRYEIYRGEKTYEN